MGEQGGNGGDGNDVCLPVPNRWVSVCARPSSLALADGLSFSLGSGLTDALASQPTHSAAFGLHQTRTALRILRTTVV